MLRIIIGLVIIILLEYYFFRKSTKSISHLFPKVRRRNIKVINGVIIFLLNLYPAVLLGGLIVSLLTAGSGRTTLQGSFYDIFLIFPFWIGIMILLQSVIFFLLVEVVKIALKFFVETKEKLLRIEALLIFIIISFSALYVPFRITYDYYKVSLNEFVIYKEDLNEDLEDFRLVFVSDIQADRYTKGKRLQNYVDVVNSADADLILAAGDFITSGPDFVDTAAYYSGKMQNTMGFYSCIGDHDHWVYREDRRRSLLELSTALERHNVYLVHNKNEIFKYKTAEIKVTFVTNSYVNFINVDSLLDLTSAEKVDLNIIVSHQPKMESILEASSAGYDLFLAGHTHGGQITFLFPFKNLSPTLFETRFVKGLFTIKDMSLIVSRGLGMSLAPIRYNSTPEVILIRFRKGNN
jgi:uncharacterized protein